MNLKNKIQNLIKKKRENNSNLSQEVRYKSSNNWSIAILWTIIGSFGFGIIFACISRIDEVVITRGELQAVGAERPIKIPIDGIVSKILVKEGEEVELGQVLLELEYDVFIRNKEKLEFQIASNKEIYLNEEDMLTRYETLLKDGGVSLFEYLTQKNKVNEIKSKIKELESELQVINYQLSKTIIKSPLKGKVFNLIPSSPGYAASKAETLLLIVPSEELEAKIFFNNSDIGFLRDNMSAEIRIDSYPFTQFGHIKGNLKAIGKEALPPDQFNPQARFPGYVKLSKQYLERKNKKYFIQSGQTLSANFVVRDKPLITLLTDVIANAWDSLRGIKTEGSVNQKLIYED